MLTTMIFAFFIMLAVVGGMAVGTLRGKPIKGSCGGISAEDGFDCACARAGIAVDERPCSKPAPNP